MYNRRTLGVMTLTAVTALAAGPAAAQGLTQVVIDTVPYVLPADAANNVDAVRALIATAQAQGLIRNVVRTLVGTIQTMEFRGTGTMDGQNMSFVVSYDYRLPAIREDVTMANKARTVSVASGDLSWDESKPGVFTQAGKTSAAERLMPLWLLPSFVVYQGAETAGQIKLTTTGGMRVLTIPVPRYKTELKATLNTEDQIVRTEMSVGGKLYSADFSNYGEDRMQYHVYFPHKIVEKVDGQTVADLTVESHVPGPYAVWPVPADLTPTAGN
jgi:hypothetical protein